jgi:hypothetical protein
MRSEMLAQEINSTHNPLNPCFWCPPKKAIRRFVKSTTHFSIHWVSLSRFLSTVECGIRTFLGQTNITLQVRIPLKLETRANNRFMFETHNFSRVPFLIDCSAVFCASVPCFIACMLFSCSQRENPNIDRLLRFTTCLTCLQVRVPFGPEPHPSPLSFPPILNEDTRKRRAVPVYTGFSISSQLLMRSSNYSPEMSIVVALKQTTTIVPPLSATFSAFFFIVLLVRQN